MPALRFAVVFLLFGSFVAAQVCRISVAGVNQARRVTGDIHVECPEEIVHSPPFGNWGVTSNFGQKRDSHQFDGWCHNTRVCDNAGRCQTDCTDGWYEWNSCTDHPLYRAPNCSLFNANSCTEQVSTTGTNVHGTKLVDVPVSCPADTDGDGIADRGGCADIKEYSSGTNFLSLYELDPVCCDELVQTVYYPAVTIPLSCNSAGCTPAGSPWLDPISWDSPTTPAKVFAQMAVVVNSAVFVDTSGKCPAAAADVRVVNAASYSGTATAPESIATLFGTQLVSATGAAASVPLPTVLAGASVVIKDEAGSSQMAPLFYVSPGQINFLIPATAAPGVATISVYNGGVLRASGRVRIALTAPGIFTQNADGKGAPAASVLSSSGGSQPAFTCGSVPGSCTPAAIVFGPPEQEVYLTLYGTGIRNRTSLEAVSASIDGVSAPVTYAGPQAQFTGLDQVNVLLPRELAGRGTVDLVLTVDGKAANTVQLAFR